MTATMASRRRWIWVVSLFVGILLIAGLAFVVWALWIPAPMPEALAALESDDRVAVTEAGVLTFTPVADAEPCGLIFYPGGRVVPRSYAPAMRAIAEDGFMTAIVPMPLNLAFLGVGRAEGVIAAHPEISNWVLAGHSLGGSAAAFYVHDNPDSAQGLALWASYTTEGKSIAERTDLEVTSISGSLDGLATPEKIAAGEPYLPPQTRFVEIEGGNHAQFGWYGEQSGDNAATITREEQQEQTVAATLELMDAVCGSE